MRFITEEKKLRLNPSLHNRRIGQITTKKAAEQRALEFEELRGNTVIIKLNENELQEIRDK